MIGTTETTPPCLYMSVSSSARFPVCVHGLHHWLRDLYDQSGICVVGLALTLACGACFVAGRLELAAVIMVRCAFQPPVPRDWYNILSHKKICGSFRFRLWLVLWLGLWLKLLHCRLRTTSHSSHSSHPIGSLCICVRVLHITPIFLPIYIQHKQCP